MFVALKAAVLNLESLRSAVDASQRMLDGVTYNNKPVHLGELTVAAEYRLVNKNLEAQIASLKTLLDLERQANKVFSNCYAIFMYNVKPLI